MVQKTVLPCGLTVISEKFPEFPSFALSYTLKSGSRAETMATNGIHHLIEHMLFKGSAHYDMKQIADMADRLGGRLNAFTGKEITQYYIKSIDEKLSVSFQLLSDIIVNSTFPEDEFLKEKNVIIQEIRESEDNPDSNAFETLYEKIFNDNPLGYPIGGKKKQLARLERNQVLGFYREKYVPGNLLLSAAGNIEHRELVELAADFFSRFPARPALDFEFARANFQPRHFFKKNVSLSQCYIITALDSISLLAPFRHPFMIMNDILGSGMSSRLFQSIREEKGLAYTVSSFIDSYLECGVQIIYAVIDPEKIAPYLQAVKDEVELLKKEGIRPNELERAKDHIKSSIILSLENNVSKMSFNTNQELYFKKELDVASIITEINAATRDDINGFCRQYLNLDQAALFTYGRPAAAPAWPQQDDF
ncbi:MAG: insulinase family protein [Candidatus Aminicenantes bacterium]|nr:insulinase family protein [Candidatus Aminicenantes bacterium]